MMETKRLILRPWQESDAEALFRYASDPDVGPRAGWPPHKDVEESRSVIRHIFTNDRTWAITLKETGEAIGCIGYYVYGESNIEIGEEDAEIGYWLARPYWNQGICTEALQLMLDYIRKETSYVSIHVWIGCERMIEAQRHLFSEAVPRRTYVATPRHCPCTLLTCEVTAGENKHSSALIRCSLVLIHALN